MNWSGYFFRELEVMDKILFDLWRMGFSLEELGVAYDDYSEEQIRAMVARGIKQFALAERKRQQEINQWRAFKESFTTDLQAGLDNLKKVYIN